MAHYIRVLLVLVGALAALPAIAEAQEQKAVLITGASSGIGRNMAETLAAEGYFVYAGARKPEDIAELSALDNIMGVRLDVTIQEDIDAAVELVRDEGRGLYGLVNNAGVAVLWPLIEIEESEMDFQIDVNLMGPYRVTRAFAPLIIESKGRITTTGSISGILSGALFGPYSISKHGVEAFTDSLAREMAQFDVAVSVIEPGNYSSSIMDNIRGRMERRGLNYEGSRYEEQLTSMLERMGDYSQYDAPDDVSAALVKFLADESPKRRYMVVPNEFQAEITVRQLLIEMVQLNEGQRYEYSRDELVAMLDEVLAESNR